MWRSDVVSCSRNAEIHSVVFDRSGGSGGTGPPPAAGAGFRSTRSASWISAEQS